MAEANSLKARSIKGVAWNAAGNVVQQLTLLVTMVVLARILSPQEFGIYALLMVFVSFSQILAQMGTASAVIYFDDLSDRFLSTVFYFTVGTSLAVYLLLAAGAGFLADFMEEPALRGLIQLIGLVLVINSLGMIQRALLEKKMDFRKVILVEKSSLLVSSGIGITAAILGFGAKSFVMMALSQAILQLIGFTIFGRWRPRWMFGVRELRRMLSYSLNLVGFTIINYFARQSDNFLVGKFIGSGALGIYSVAYRIMLYPLENVSRVLIRVLFPAFSEVKHDNARFKRGYVQAISFIALVTFPLMLGLLAVAPLFVDVVFGEGWEELAPLLMILSLVGLQQSIVTTVGSIYLAKGTTGTMFWIGGINAVVTVLFFLGGVWFGIRGMAIAYLIANLLMLYPNLHYAWRQIELGVAEGLGELMPFLVTAIIMGVGVVVADRLGLFASFLPVFELGFLVLLGVLIYSAVLIVWARPRILALVNLLRRRTSATSLQTA